MAPLPPESTARFKVFYTVGTHQHTMEFRSGASPSAVGTIIDDFLTALNDEIYILTIDEVQFAANGSVIFNAITTGVEGSSYGTGAEPNEATPFYLSFIGRSPGGRRVRIYVFGSKSLYTDYRVTALENVDVDAAIAVLVAAGGSLLAIDGGTPIWKTYANMGVNAHWQKAIRP